MLVNNSYEYFSPVECIRYRRIPREIIKPSCYDEMVLTTQPQKEEVKQAEKPSSLFKKIKDKLVKSKECPKYFAKDQSKYYKNHNIIPANVSLSYGFVDIADKSSNEQDIILDPQNDMNLNLLTDIVMIGYYIYDEEDLAKRIMIFLTPEAGKEKSELMPSNYAGEAIKDNNPRAMALAFKHIADVANIKADLIKGTLNGNPHAWNVVHFKDGSQKIYDCANNKILTPEEAENSYKRNEI